MLNKRGDAPRGGTAFAELGVDLPDPARRSASLSGGQRQSVAVARAVAFASNVIFMDEPTAALGVVQRGRVLDTVRRVRDRGVAVVLISHNMPEVLAVADRIEVLRLGRRVARFQRRAGLGGGPGRRHDRRDRRRGRQPPEERPGPARPPTPASQP